MSVREDRDAALCLDISLAETAKDSIRAKMLDFAAEIFEGDCHIEDGAHHSSATSSGSGLRPGKLQPSLNCESAGFGSYKDAIEEESKKTTSKESEMFGEIRLIGEPDPAQLLFTVPLEATSTGSKRGEHLLLCRVALSHLRFKGLLWPATTFVFGALFVANLVFAMIDYRRRLRVQEMTLEIFAGVMGAARDAYCRVTYDHKFIDINDAFAHLLGYENREEGFTEIRSGTFLDLLDDPSKKVYVEHTEKRVKRIWMWKGVEPKRGEPYDIMIGKPRSASRRKATVHGAAVPLPIGPHGKYETFGIILS